MKELTLKTIIRTTEDKAGATFEEVYNKGIKEKVSDARQILVFFMRYYLHMNLEEISQTINMSTHGAKSALNHFGRRLEKHKKFEGIVEAVKKELDQYSKPPIPVIKKVEKPKAPEPVVEEVKPFVRERGVYSNPNYFQQYYN